MKHLWTKSLPEIYNCWFYGALIKEDLHLKYYFFHSNIAGISDLSLNIDNGEIISVTKNPNEVQKNKELYNTRSHYSEDDFVFGEYRITHYGQFGYACFKADKLLWKKSLRGYLYTDIIKNNDRIIFGTNGMGGHFYSVNIDSGEIVFDFNNKQ